jgi:hypothetical protein
MGKQILRFHNEIKNLHYDYKMDCSFLFYLFFLIKTQVYVFFLLRFWLPKPEDNFFTELRYLRGFIQIQDILDRSIISLQTGIDIDNPAFLQEFPSTCYTKDM